MKVEHIEINGDYIHAHIIGDACYLGLNNTTIDSSKIWATLTAVVNEIQMVLNVLDAAGHYDAPPKKEDEQHEDGAGTVPPNVF